MKIIMVFIIRCVFLLFLSGWSVASFASCSYRDNTTASTYTVTVPTLNVQRDMNAGTILWDSGYLRSANSVDIYCNSVENIYRGYDDPSLTQIKNLDNNVYQTNNPGIGIRIWWVSYDDHGSFTPNDARTFYSPTKAEGSKTCNGCQYFGVTGIFDVQLVATGQPITDDSLQLTRFSGSRTYGTATQIHINFTDADVVVNSASCILNNKTIRVDLGQHIEGYRLTHPGDTSTPVGFNIDLTCDASTNVNVLFSGTTVSGDNTTLALSKPEDSTSAKGVGVQILYNDQPISFGTLLPMMQNVNEGSINLPFKAQVLRLNEDLGAGDINATATFDMIYR